MCIRGLVKLDNVSLHTDINIFKKVKVTSYIAQYPVLRTAQRLFRFTSLADLLNQTPFQLLWDASSHMLQLMREGCSYTYHARYSFIQPSELKQRRVNKLAQGFNAAAQDSNPGVECRVGISTPGPLRPT